MAVASADQSEPMPKCSALQDLPVELWTSIAFLAYDGDAESALCLVQTCKSFYTSPAGKAVRYLTFLDRHSFPHPPRLPDAAFSSSNSASTSDIDRETSLLSQSRWPGRINIAAPFVQSRQHESDLNPVPVVGDPEAEWWRLPVDYFWPRLCVGGRKVAALSRSGRKLDIWNSEKWHEEEGNDADVAVRCEEAIMAWDVDVDEGVAILVHATSIESDDHVHEQGSEASNNEDDAQHAQGWSVLPRRRPLHQLTLAVYDLATGQPHPAASSRQPRHQLHRACIPSEDLTVEVLGSHVLLRAGDSADVFRWAAGMGPSSAATSDRHKRARTAAPTASASISRSQSPSSASSWPHVWSRPPSHSPVLSAHLLGLSVIAVLSHPASSEHARDWGSSIEFYRWDQQSQDGEARVAEIQLPIRARPATERYSYIKTGLGKRWTQRDQNAAVAVCIEGYVWMADLRSFADILFPQQALAVFGSSYLTLDSQWVRAHMHKCSLSSPQTYPTSLSLSGWRVAAIWSRPLSTSAVVGETATTTHGQSVATSGSTPPPQQQPDEGTSGLAVKAGASAKLPTIFLRALDANPRHTDPQKVTSRDQRPDLPDDEPLIYTVFTGDRFSAYCDHDLTRQLGDSTWMPVDVQIDGPRTLISSTTSSKLLVG
ncbi:hypothetical protein BDZ90DRAFT_177407 [Jaminaea rosea]|uniref:F-box domain-containing protein n=1 Tax=Jaminaea rosea TaxID=1569628 RepID=A0A316UU25_9BASI|nr:hypothetical protein BDZ90DRAFT_177407 [Jaminaea rosea]PWN27403.1 hypothetical protein BDZ90DRAFT_177407 [Jaminaea rosea]